MGDDDANRAGERGRLGEDHVLAATVGHGHVIPAAGRDRPHADDDLQVALLHDRRQAVMDVVAAGHGAPRGVDPENDRLDRLVVGDPVELLAGESRSPHDCPDHIDDRHPAGGVLGERVPAFLDLSRLLEISRIGAEARDRHQRRHPGDCPGDPRPAFASAPGLTEDHRRRRRVGERAGEGRGIHRGRLLFVLPGSGTGVEAGRRSEPGIMLPSGDGDRYP